MDSYEFTGTSQNDRTEPVIRKMSNCSSASCKITLISVKVSLSFVEELFKFAETLQIYRF